MFDPTDSGRVAPSGRSDGSRDLLEVIAKHCQSSGWHVTRLRPDELPFSEPPAGWLAQDPRFDDWPLRTTDGGGDPELTPAGVEPSGVLAQGLDTFTSRPGELSDAQLVDSIAAYERVAAWAAARQARLLAEFAGRRPGDDAEAAQSDTCYPFSRWAPDEIGLALTLSRGTATIRLNQATRLGAELPAVLQAWQDGRLDATKVRAILNATDPLTPDLAAAVAERILPRAAEQTAGKLRAALDRAVIDVDRDGAAQRLQEARRGRRVAVNPDRDGMAWLSAHLTAPDALSCHEWLTRLAKGMGTTDPRGLDARRADLLVALLTGRLTVAGPDTVPGEPADGAGRVPMPQPVTPGKPLIQLIIPLTTVTGGADHPGDLVGYGPVPADLAREIAADGVWRRLITDPLSGALLDHGRKTYRPPDALREFVKARDVHCRHPICNRRATDSELDHAVAWKAGNGETNDANLYNGCVHHHHLKHDAPGWSVQQHPDGRVTWTTPTGHAYTSDPYDYRYDDEPDYGDYVRRRSARSSTGKPPPPTPPVPAGFAVDVMGRRIDGPGSGQPNPDPPQHYPPPF